MINKLAVLLAISLLSDAQLPPLKKSPAFDPKAYPPNKFKISRKDYPLGEITVRVTQVRNEGYTMDPDTCRAWLEVKRGDQLVKRLYYANIEPVGGNYGIFVPNQQPSPDYFVAVKDGDYDGRLFVVSKDGQLADVLGGSYFLTADHKFLVSEYSSDLHAIVVFDVGENRKVLESRNIPEIDTWYQDDDGYFFTEYGKPGHADRLDLVNGKLTKIRVTHAEITKAHKVRDDFDTAKKQDCSSQPQ
jgi:hypothetical protein